MREMEVPFSDVAYGAEFSRQDRAVWFKVDDAHAVDIMEEAPQSRYRFDPDDLVTIFVPEPGDPEVTIDPRWASVRAHSGRTNPVRTLDTRPLPASTTNAIREIFERDGHLRFTLIGDDLVIFTEATELRHEVVEQKWKASKGRSGDLGLLVRGYATGRGREADEVTVWFVDPTSIQLQDPRENRLAERRLKVALGQLVSTRVVPRGAQLEVELDFGVESLGEVREWLR